MVGDGGCAGLRGRERIAGLVFRERIWVEWQLGFFFLANFQNPTCLFQIRKP